MKGAVHRTELPVPGMAAATPLRLDLGCGKTTPEGWVGIDAIDFGQAIIADVSVAPWVLFAPQVPDWAAPAAPSATFMMPAHLPLSPQHRNFRLPDNSVDEVRSSHFVEHLTGAQRIGFFNELWRVMKPGANALIVTPNWSHACAYGDPTHQWPPMSQWYPLYLHREWRAGNAPHAGYTCHFDHVVAGSWDASLEVKTMEVRQFAMQNYINGCRDLIVTLTKRE